MYFNYLYRVFQLLHNTVNHEILLAKMKNYGIRGVIYIGLLVIRVTEDNILLLVITVLK